MVKYISSTRVTLSDFVEIFCVVCKLATPPTDKKKASQFETPNAQAKLSMYFEVLFLTCLMFQLID